MLIPNWDPEVCFRIWQATAARVFNADLRDLIAELGSSRREEKVIAIWADYCGVVDKRSHASSETNDVANLIRHGLPADDCFVAITYSLVHGNEYKGKWTSEYSSDGKSGTKGLSLAAMRQGMHTEDVISSILAELQEELVASGSEDQYVVERRDHPDVSVRAYPSKGEPPSPMIFLSFTVRQARAVGRELMHEVFDALPPEVRSALEALPPASLEEVFTFSAQKRQRLRSLDDEPPSEGRPTISVRDASDILVHSLFGMELGIEIQLASDYADWAAAFRDAATVSATRSLDQASWVQFLRDLPDPSRIRLRGVLTFEYKNVDNTRHGVAGTIEREYWFEQLDPANPAHRFIILHAHFKGAAYEYVKAQAAGVSDAVNPAAGMVTAMSVFHSSNTRRFVKGIENTAFHKGKLSSDAASSFFGVSKEKDRLPVFSSGFPGRDGSRKNDPTWNVMRDQHALRHELPTQLRDDSRALIWAMDPSMHPVNLNERLRIPVIRPERNRSLSDLPPFETLLQAALTDLMQGEAWSSFESDEQLQLRAAQQLLSTMSKTITIVGPDVDTLAEQVSTMVVAPPMDVLGGLDDGSCEFLAQCIAAIMPANDQYAKYADAIRDAAFDLSELQLATDADLDEVLVDLGVRSGVHQDDDSATSELQVEDSPLSKIRNELQLLMSPTTAPRYPRVGASASTRGLNEEVREDVKYAVTGPETVEHNASAFILQIWAMVLSKMAMFERELKLLRQQGIRQHASKFDDLSSATTELIIQVRVAGCAVTPEQRQITWTRGLKSSSHSVEVPPQFPPDSPLHCEVLIYVPNQLRESFQASFTIGRGPSSMEVAALLATNDLRIRYLEAQVRFLESWMYIPPELLKAGTCRSLNAPSLACTH